MATILATLCYLDNGNEWLLLHRNKRHTDIHYGKWIGVGGKFKQGESPQECASREIKEETGLTVRQLSMKGTIMFPKFDGENDWLVFVFIGTQITGQLKTCDEGTLEWVKREAVLHKPTWSGDSLFLKWLLEDKPFFSAKMTYHHQELIDWSVEFY